MFACDEESADCVVGEHELSIGETVADTELGVVCTCTAEGPGCSSLLPDMGREAVDAEPPSDGALADAERDMPLADVELDAGPSKDGAVPDPDAQLPDMAPPPPDAAPDMMPDAACGFGGECSRAEAVCARWASRADLVEGEWNGDVEACEPGDMTPEWRADAVAYVNIYRYLAGIHLVEDDERKNEKAQECALALHARGGITHHLDEEVDPCYTPGAAEAAARSNIHSRPAVWATPEYMSDWGMVNFVGLPHRLWMLSLSLGPIGIGSTNRYSCMYVAGGVRRPEPQWVAWPSPGPFPVSANNANNTGWSIHSSRVNMGRGELTVSVDGEELPVIFRHLRAEGGAGHGVAFVPDGWAGEAGVTYHVVLEGAIAQGVPVPIEYDIEMIDCAAE